MRMKQTAFRKTVGGFTGPHANGAFVPAVILTVIPSLLLCPHTGQCVSCLFQWKRCQYITVLLVPNPVYDIEDITHNNILPNRTENPVTCSNILSILSHQIIGCWSHLVQPVLLHSEETEVERERVGNLSVIKELAYDRARTGF